MKSCQTICIKMNEEKIRQFIQEELQNLLDKDIDKSNVTAEQVREIFREEIPAFLARSLTTIEGNLQLLDSRNIIVGGTTGSKIGTSTSQKLGFWNKSPSNQPSNGADLTNNVAVGGTTDTIANYTDLTTYATDAAAIRNNLYQLAKKLKVVNDALRSIGIMS